MKKLLLFLCLFMAFRMAFAQDMMVKVKNFYSFHEDKKSVTPLLLSSSSEKAQQHPEFGILPYNSPCDQCVEIIDKRTVDSRFYTDAYDAAHIYSQKSFFPLHYKKSKNDVWRTIDFRLHPDAANPGVYIADKQPFPSKCDLNRKSASLFSGDIEFEFNRNLKMYFFNEDLVYTKEEPGNYSNMTIGEDGMMVKNMWEGVDMEQVFSTSRIETNYIIRAPLQLPVKDGWMVVEDHFNLPEGITIEESSNGKHAVNGYFQGDYLLKDKYGDTLFTLVKPMYVDAKAFGMQGYYNLIKNEDGYTLQTLIPLSFLTRSDNTYPLFIDPTNIVTGQSKRGEFTSQGTSNYFQYGFTTVTLGSCNYGLTVDVPGKSQLTNCYVDLEYQLTYDDACGNPPLPTPYCTFSQVYQKVLCDSCQTITPILQCNPAQPPFTGTCTTDSNLVPGAHSILINTFVPNYLGCYQPQCPDFEIPFTLENQDSTCGDICGYLCARGHVWIMTVEACRVTASLSESPLKVCAGQPATFTATGSCGVPPYHYLWSADNGNTYDTVYGTNIRVYHPDSSFGVQLVIVDTCDEPSTLVGPDSVFVVPTPTANAGTDTSLCAANGGTVTLGGSPTTDSLATSIQWTAISPAQQAWINAPTSANPEATVPPGTADTTYSFIVTATSPQCSRSDTINISTLSNPVGVIDSTGPTTFCVGNNVTLVVAGSYASYLWNTGSTASSISVTQSGQYFVVVTDQNGCKDTSNFIVVTTVVPPTFNVYPDTSIKLGDSVLLYTDIALSSVDSFTWYPMVNISCLTCFNPEVSPITDQYYGLTVYTQGCAASDSALISIILPNNYYIPNVFTPNGDGNNDEFYIYCQSGVKVILFQVFDRLGEKVHDGTYPWDGSYKGKPAPPGVYVYVFKLGLYGDDSAIFAKGSVTLLR